MRWPCHSSLCATCHTASSFLAIAPLAASELCGLNQSILYAYVRTSMKFVDYVTITVRSGRGGAGAVAFRREKYEPQGGPAGGDGGNGGSVIIEGDSNLYTLLDFRYNRHHFAENGETGAGNNRTGRSGQDIVLRVPLGTVARQRGTGEIIGEVCVQGERLILAEGGRGGKGNAFFKSPTNQTPRHAQPGEAGR